MLSLPPLAPMATRSPRKKREEEVMVSWTSVSNMVRKQVLHSFWRFLGRMMTALASWQLKQSVGGIFFTVPVVES